MKKYLDALTALKKDIEAKENQKNKEKNDIPQKKGAVNQTFADHFRPRGVRSCHGQQGWRGNDQPSEDQETKEGFAELFEKGWNPFSEAGHGFGMAADIGGESMANLFENQGKAGSSSAIPGVHDTSSIRSVGVSKPSYEVQDRLDLHGFTAADAEKKVRFFIENCAYKGLKVILIITGKGLHSDGPAILPATVEHLLLEMKERGQITAYVWEKGVQYRSGAIVVYLP